MISDDEFPCAQIKESALDVSKGKRQRSSNFTSQEEDILMSLVEQQSHIVENRTTNAVSWQQKSDAWEKIALQFGIQCNNIRSVKNLRDKYENMKRKSKIALSNERAQLYKTGGGPHCSKVTDGDKRIQALLGKAATGLYNENDSDSLNREKQNDDDVFEVEFLDEYKEVEVKEPAQVSTEENIDKVLAKQAIFFENEDRRAEERHQLQKKELQLKSELLSLEIALKELEIEKHRF